jgi:hypothetical protein
MRRSPNSFTAAVAALLLGCGLLAPALPAAQETDGKPRSPQVAPPEAAPSTPTEFTAQAQPEADDAGRSAAGPEPSTAPPKHLKRVGDHWTPYDPPDPESFPPDATLHVIVRGETLWDLADLTFNNPYLWPQIWNENRYILDSHWIYPGDPLLLPARPIVVTGTTPTAERSTVPTEVVPQGGEAAPPPGPVADLATPEPIQQPLSAESPETSGAETPAAGAPDDGTQDDSAHAPRTVPKLTRLTDDTDLRCSGYIAPKDSNPDYFIADQQEDGKLGLVEGDIVYLSRGSLNGHVDPGTEYSVVVREGEVRHPVTRKFIGYYYRRVGTVRLLAAQERTAIAVISQACDEIRTGYDLVPLRVISKPGKPAPPFDRMASVGQGKRSGHVVHVLDNIARVGTWHIVDVNLGYEDGVEPGDYLTVFIPNEPFDRHRVLHYDYVFGNQRIKTPALRRDDSLTFPEQAIGQIVVLTTERHTATAKIIYATQEIEVGAEVELP